MIERLIVRDFQAHKKRDLRLGRITVLAGPSGTGKTATLRALRWACLNDTAGDEFVRWGAETASVKVYTDGHKVTRSRGKQNTYALDDKDYKAFGRTVPQDVSKLLAVADDNFQDQLEPHYWFSLTPGEVSKQLNRIVNLDVIDTVLGRLGSKARDAASTVRVTEKRLAEAVTKRDDLRWALDADALLGKLESTEAAADDAKGRHDRLAAALAELTTVDAEVALLDKVINPATGLKKARLASRMARRRHRGLRTAVKLVEMFDRALAGGLPDVDRLGRIRANGDHLASEFMGLDAIIRELEDNALVKRTVEKCLAQKENDFSKLGGGTCRLCGQQLPPRSKHRHGTEKKS